MAEESPQPRRYVVDSNVLVYYALGTPPFHEEVSVLFSKPFELIAPEDREMARTDLQKTLEEGSSEAVEYALLRKDGSR